jgi:formamidopyrimidine-DNA glycosylase
MPELPEVETTLRGITSFVNKQRITKVIVRHPRLRWPIPEEIKSGLCGQFIHDIKRRAKYILFYCDSGTMILHLGMSGRLRILNEAVDAGKHDHVDICLENGYYLRFTDPRRFGALLWTEGNPEEHPLIASIGPEPLSKIFNGEYLWKESRKRKVPVKSFIMDSHTVAGVGNIYATESLFMASIHPQKPAGSIDRKQYDLLAEAIKKILKQAIKKGGTTLKDFRKSDGAPGYFSQKLQVYGNAGKPCLRCKTKLQSIRIAQRSTVYCPKCQPK